jgi:hypothetical protein
MIFLKAIVSAILLGFIGLLVGPIVALMVLPFPGEACGMYWIIPVATGGVYGLAGGGLLGLILGLLT